MGRAISPHDPTNALISEDRNNYPLVEISRIDGHLLVFWESVKVNLKFEIGRVGLIVKVGGRLQRLGFRARDLKRVRPRSTNPHSMSTRMMGLCLSLRGLAHLARRDSAMWTKCGEHRSSPPSYLRFDFSSLLSLQVLEGP